MKYSLCLQATYNKVDVALCNDQFIIDSLSIPNQSSSAQLVVSLDQLLKKNSLSIKDCLYIAANQGPAPFTTLRTILATINGIQAAINIPLIGIDGLQSLITQHKSKNYTYTIALLNAFNNELYYAIYFENNCITGYASCENIVSLIKETIGNDSALIIGNGIEILKKEYSDASETQIFFDTSIAHLTIADVVHIAQKAWSNGDNFTIPLMPLYLKKHAAERV